VVAGVAIFTDVTERKTLEQEKETYLAAITHDLRNPLTVISGNAHLLLREATRGGISEERLHEGLDWIAKAANQMAAQLSELQDVARLRTGQGLELHRSVVDLVALVREAVARHQSDQRVHEFSLSTVGLAGTELLGVGRAAPHASAR
jgi:signal transduction histidine kinase